MVKASVEASMTITKPKSLCHQPKKEAYLERIKAQNAHSLDNCNSQIYFSSIQDFLKTIKSAVNEPISLNESHRTSIETYIGNNKYGTQ